MNYRNKVNIRSAAPQLTLAFDSSHTSQFNVNVNGVLNIAPSGVTTIFTAASTVGASINIPESGTSPTTPNTGDIWSLTSDHNLHYRTNSVTHIVPKVLIGSATLDFPSTGPNATSTLNITVTGAQVGDPVAISVPLAAVNANSFYTAYVSATNTVTVQFSTIGGLLGTNPASGVFTAVVFRLN